MRTITGLAVVAILTISGIFITMPQACAGVAGYLGCYTDEASRAMPDQLLSGGSTVEMCVALAHSKGFTYAGLQYGGQCFAGNDLGYNMVNDSRCNMPCSADGQETCGAGYLNSVYSAQAAASSLSSNFNYIGCYPDQSSRLLPAQFANPGGTVEGCIAQAKSLGLLYAGLQYGGQCFAGNALVNSAVDLSNCSMHCSGNAAEFCGGPYFNSVYTTGAHSGVNVTMPVNNSSVLTNFNLNAGSVNCFGQTVASMGYSFDDSSQTVVLSGTSIQAVANVEAGNHLLHVKSWGNQGASCKTDIPITVLKSGVAVSTPVKGMQVGAPFNLQASANICSGQPVGSMGYSLDDETLTTIIPSNQIDTLVSVTAGSHILHVKAWGNQGASCSSDVNINALQGPQIPSNAIIVRNIQALSNWSWNQDHGVQGASYGESSLVNVPSLSGQARNFTQGFINSSAELYHVPFDSDPSSTNFVYDVEVMIPGATSLANVEMDMNQVISNGNTIIYGVQCDGWSSTWDYAVNAATTSAPLDAWPHTNVSCNPNNWSLNTWHHIQMLYSRDAVGKVTYQSVWFDGVESDFLNSSGASADSLGWPSTLLLNFQLDGKGVLGSNNAYVDNLTVYRW